MPFSVLVGASAWLGSPDVSPYEGPAVTQRELRNLVTWTVEESPPRARIGRLFRTVVSTIDTVASFGATAGASTGPTWTLPADPDAYVDIGLVQVRGDAPWLLGGRVRRQRLQATQRAVMVSDTAGRRAPALVPVKELRIAHVRPRSGRRQSRHAEAPWTLALTGSGNVDVHGPWLALAWIGHVAGWPEPVTG